MDLKHLESLCKVAELGSFTLAAEALFLTQPTVTAHIQALERELGIRLFDRLGRRVVLTPAGEVLYRHAQEILKLRDRIREDLRDLGAVKDELRLVASTLPGEYLLPRVLVSLLKEVPHGRVTLEILDSQRVIAEVEGDRAEMGVVGMRKRSEKIAFQPLLKDRVILAAHRSHPMAGREVSWEDLSGETLITREPGSGTRQAFEKALRQRGLSSSLPQRVVELGSTTAVKEAVKAGLGLGIISDIALRGELGEDILEVRIRELGEVQRTFYLVTRKGKTLSPLAKRLSEILSTTPWTQGL